MKSSRTRVLWISAMAAFGLFALLILLLYTADVADIGPLGSSVGLSTLNGSLRDAIGQSELWYAVSEWMGYLSFLSAALFFGIGVFQLCTRKSLRQVDPDLYVLALLYAAVAVFYVLFEVFAVNDRPILVDGALEASFPSSHTMLVCSLMGGAAYQALRRLSKAWLRYSALTLCTLLAAATVVGRLLSGVHWFTDILGGLLLSTALVLTYVALCRTVQK